MKKQILIYIARPLTSKYSKSLIEQMQFLDLYSPDEYELVIFTATKTLSGLKYLTDIIDLNFKAVFYTDAFNKCLAGKYNNWLEFIDAEINIFDEFQNVEAVYLFGGLLSDATAITRNKNYLNKIRETRNQMKFQSNAINISIVLLLVEYAKRKNINFYEYCYDPCENSIDLLNYKPEKTTAIFCYDSKLFNFKRHDSLQYYLLKKVKRELVEKVYDFTFGFTVLTPARNEYFNSIIELLKNYNCKTFIRNKYTEEDTFVDRDTYLQYIKKSRFTFIVYSYEPKAFSALRFFESVYNYCLPIILDDVYYYEFVESFNIDNEIFEELLIKNFDKITEERRVQLLEYFYEKCFTNLIIGELL